MIWRHRFVQVLWVGKGGNSWPGRHTTLYCEDSDLYKRYWQPSYEARPVIPHWGVTKRTKMPVCLLSNSNPWCSSNRIVIFSNRKRKKINLVFGFPFQRIQPEILLSWLPCECPNFVSWLSLQTFWMHALKKMLKKQISNMNWKQQNNKNLKVNLSSAYI